MKPPASAWGKQFWNTFRFVHQDLSTKNIILWQKLCIVFNCISEVIFYSRNSDSVSDGVVDAKDLDDDNDGILDVHDDDDDGDSIPDKDEDYDSDGAAIADWNLHLIHTFYTRG